jgi:hypothetical protein
MDGNIITLDQQRRERMLRLRSQREEILSLAPEAALKRILEEKQPAALVHSFPEEDFYFLIHDIGLNDALPLLALASDRQRQYIIDMEGWHHDRLQLNSMTNWLNAMYMADPERVLSWLFKEQTDLLELLLFRNIQVILREHDQDTTHIPDDFFTHDDIYYVQILDDPLVSVEDASTSNSDEQLLDDQRRDFFYSLLSRLADRDHQAYQKLLLEANSILPAEVEEEVYRMRNVRMAEKGFLPFEEAIGIYQPTMSEELKAQSPKSFGKHEDESETALLPIYPVKMLREGGPFSDALQEIDSVGLLQRIQLEFITLCNQVISADQKKIQTREALQVVVKKACGYLNIGLEAYVPEDIVASKSKSAAMAALVQRLPLSQIFRFGYGRALALKWQVQRWRKEAWFEKSGLPLTFWDEKWLGVLGGLLVEKPLYFDNYQTGRTLYREFKSLEDIVTTERMLSYIIRMDSVLGGMSIRCRPDANHLLTWRNLILTLWVRFHLGLDSSGEFDVEGRLTPLSKTEFTAFFKDLFSLMDPTVAAGPGKTGKMVKTEFLKWLTERAKKTSEEITTTLGPVLDELFNQVDEELGNIRPDDIDPRYIQLFRVK